MAGRPQVVITDSDLASTADERVLREGGMAAVRLAVRTEEELVAALARIRADALIVQWAPVSAAVLDAAPACRFVSRLGIGIDMVDVAAATERGVAVANTPDYCVEEVTAHTLAMALWLLRGLGRYDTAVRHGEWAAAGPPPEPCRPSATTIGVVGLGRIGTRVCGQARALGFEVVGCDPYATAEPGLRLVTFEELLRRSDLVTLHAPLSPETSRMIRADTIALMRPGALLVNTCRGGLVDEAAVIEAMRSGQLAGAALDVFEAEPLAADSGLRSLSNVLLTPHAAWYSPASLAELPVRAARQVVDFLTGLPVPSIVNPAYLDNAAARGALRLS
jgi:D-3-phosphoglycerate dehydrogenase / 2-oxoglutarate reductase